MWHSVSLFGVYWLAFMNTLDKLSEPNILFVILLFTGWGVLGLIGVCLQQFRHPSLLATRKHPNLLSLYKFAWQ
jgi:hypothetical protein